MKKQRLLKTLLVAASLFTGVSAWAYEVPDGYEIKTAILGTNNGDGTVTPLNFTGVTEVPTGWTAGENVTLSMGNVTEITTLTADDSGPSYVSGDCLGIGVKKQDWSYYFAAYSFTPVSSGYLVFNGDLFVNDNNSAYLKFADEDGNNIFSFYPNSGNNGQTFRYVIGDGTATASSYQTKPRVYKGWRVRDMVFNMETGALNFSLTYIAFSSKGTSESTVNVAYNIGTGKSIAKLMIGTCSNNANVNKIVYLDNASLFTVGVSASATTYTVNAVSGETTLKLLSTNTASKGDEYAVCVPRVVEYNGAYYEWDEYDSETTTSFKKTYTMGDDSEIREISYTLNPDIVYYSEGEASMGSTETQSFGGSGAVAGATLTTGKSVGALEAGIYNMYVKITGNEGRGFAIRNTSDAVSSNQYAFANNAGDNSINFIVPAVKNFVLNGRYVSGNTTNQSADYDYVLIKKTADLPATETIKVTDAGMATYVSNYNLDFTGKSTKAYKVSVESAGVATLTELTKVPAKTPVLLVCDGGNGDGEAITITSDAIAVVTGNDLVAGTGAKVATIDGDYTNMILNNVSGIGFYLANNQTVAANRAYLHFDSSLAPAGSRMTMVFGDDTTTGINAVESAKTIDGVYNLNGQRVAQPTRGLYIMNGKKVVVK